MTHWWRAYDDAINHPKLLRLSDAMHRAWFTLQCIASANGGPLPPVDDIAVTLRTKPAKVKSWIEALRKAGLMDESGGTFTPHNWHARQFRSDNSTERVQRFRNKKRNVSETASETTPEAEAETDTEQSRADAPAAVDEDLKRKAVALGAGVSALFASRGQAVPELRRCETWLLEGYSQGTVLAAIETVLKRGRSISTLEYFDGAIRDQHAKAPQPGLQVVSSKVLIRENTDEFACWNQVAMEKTGKPLQVYRQVDDEGRECFGIRRETLYPEGFNDFGERIAPKDEAAA
jgi:hypothetical protein